MREITPNEIYSEYRNTLFFIDKGFYPKPIKNWDKIESSTNWSHFQRAAKLYNSNNGQIDYKLFILALASFFKKYYHPKFLYSMGGIKIYKSFITMRNCQSNIENIEQNVIDGIKFLKDYLKETGLDIKSYLNQDMSLIPILARHYNAGNITSYFLACIPNISFTISSYPYDVQEEYFKEFTENYDIYRAKIVNNKKLRTISDNFSKIMTIKS